MRTELQYNSIKQEVFRNSLFLSFVSLFIFGLFLTYIHYQSEMNAARSVIKQRNYAVSYFIDGYFSEIKTVVEMLADHELVRHGAKLNDEQKQELTTLYKSIASRHKYVSYLYSGYKDLDGLIINDYNVPDGYDPTSRPWYITAIQSQPHVSTGEPYADITSQEWLLSTGKALYVDGQISGVIAADSFIDAIIEKLAKHGDIYQSSYSYVITPQGRIILHPEPKYLNNNISEMVKEYVQFGREEGYLNYTLNGKNKLIHYSHTSEANWVVITVVERDEIIKGIIFEISIYLLVILVCSILLGAIQSNVLSKKFSAPLIRLKEKVNAVVQGDWEAGKNCHYPNNEIGLISQEIDKLTTDELYENSQELKKLNLLLEEKASTDRLTGLFNRHKLDEVLEAAYQRLIRYNQPFSIILLDIDYFKKVNDDYGHQMGDTTLVECAHIFERCARSVDAIGRWGGEEFMVVCPEIGLNDAKQLAERLRKHVEHHSFTIKQQVTISLGVAECLRIESIDNLIIRADNNLYTAKQHGRNQVV